MSNDFDQSRDFDVGFEDAQYMDVEFSQEEEFVVEFGGAVSGDYAGPYEVTPRVYTQILDTYGKLMEADVTVHEIPVTQTSNPYGGQTVLIG